MLQLFLRSYRAIRGALIISGTTIGAGMLGIPLLTASCGAGVAICLTVIVWAFMLLTGLLLLEACLTMDDHMSFISLAKRYLGKMGAVVTGCLFVFLYLFLLIAYFAVGAPLLQFFAQGVMNFSLNDTTSVVLFACVFAPIVAIGPKMIDRANLFMILIMAGLLILLFVLGSAEVRLSRLQHISWSGGIWATPILFSAFGYHNLIPSLVTYMQRDRIALRDAIVLGTTIPLIVYILWQILVIGAIPLDTLKVGVQEGVTATTLFAKYAHKPWISIVGQLFSFFAVTTSILGVAFSLVDFLGDGLKILPIGKKRWALTLMTFAIPLGLTLIDRSIFLRALSIAGGLGESLLNGMIPVALVYSLRYIKQVPSPLQIVEGRGWLMLLATFALVVFGVETCQLFIGH